MNMVNPPVAAVRPVNSPLNGDESNDKIELPVSEERSDLGELPQGAFVLLAQLQPLREHRLTLSLAALGSGQTIEHRTVRLSADQTMHLSDRKPLAPPVASNVQLAVPVTRLLAMAQAQAPALAPRSIPVSVPEQLSLPMIVHELVASAPPAQVAALNHISPPLVADADANASVKQEILQPLLLQPLPLLEKALYMQPATKPAAPVQAVPESILKPEACIDKRPQSYLQVPFNKGDVAGLITVSKAGAERPDQLLLSPSSASVFSHLSDSLAQTSAPRWHLTDQQGHEHSHSQGRLDEELEEDDPQAFRDKRKQEGLQA
jgi:hypothetical protein